MDLTITVDLPDPYEAAIEKVTHALKAEGFGVLTRIDFSTTMKEKLDEDFRPYIILGACAPDLAHRAMTAESQVGALLPCNVTVEAHEGGSRVQLVNPGAMLSMEPLASNPAIGEVAEEARTRFERVAAALSGE